MKKKASPTPLEEGRILGRILAKDLAQVSGSALARSEPTEPPPGQFPDDEIVSDPTTFLADGGCST